MPRKNTSKNIESNEVYLMSKPKKQVRGVFTRSNATTFKTGRKASKKEYIEALNKNDYYDADFIKAFGQLLKNVEKSVTTSISKGTDDSLYRVSINELTNGINSVWLILGPQNKRNGYQNVIGTPYPLLAYLCSLPEVAKNFTHLQLMCINSDTAFTGIEISIRGRNFESNDDNGEDGDDSDE